MQKKLHILILISLLFFSNTTYGNKTKQVKANLKSHRDLKDNLNIERVKRSLPDVDTTTWFNRGIAPEELVIRAFPKYQKDFSLKDQSPKYYFKDAHEPYIFNPGETFDSASTEISDNTKVPSNSFTFLQKDRREDLVSPFWGNRGRRSSDETEDDPFWGNRGRRQSEEDPFWGSRGRRQESEPFWGNRGRREDEPFWGNRGRREEEPFWGNRGRRDVEPFWGNRGRRQETEPFWGNRGRREEQEPFWGNRGRRFGGPGFGIGDSKREIINSESNIEDLPKLKTDEAISASPRIYFWKNRQRDSKLKHLFNMVRNRKYSPRSFPPVKGSKLEDASTVHDSRFFVDEPSFIVVDRVSRSSDEEDPYFISRGKKENAVEVVKGERERRNAFEELVKSVRNDPYFIARGKKDIDNYKDGTSNKFGKAKDLICSTIYLVVDKYEGGKVKRTTNENDRDRRTTLKKLQAQLQVDPYFVSRGKKSDKNDENFENFINQVTGMCNNIM